MKYSLLTLAISISLINAAGAADAWPQRPVRLILSFGAPGGAPDLIARNSAPKLTELWGKQVVVDPRSGAGGVLGTDIAAKAPADGYTMVIVSPAHAINPAFRKLPYDSVKDFEFVTKLVDVPNILSVFPAVAAKNPHELAALAKAKPGALSYGSAGVGSSQHLSGELFKKMAGVNIQHVPYKSGGVVVLDLIAGRVQMTFGSATSLPHIRAGRLRALAVTTSKRSSAMPELPTMNEAGYPGYEAAVWYGLLTPARTPQPIIARLHKDFSTVLRMPDVRDPLSADTIEPAPSESPKAFIAFYTAEAAKWGALVKETGAKVD